MGTKKGAWAYSAGQHGRNRVRAFEHTRGLLMIEWYEWDPPTSKRKRRRRSLKHRDRALATQQADDFAASLGKRLPIEPETLTVGQLIRMYVAVEVPEKAKTTQQHERTAARLFTDFLGSQRNIESLNRLDWDRFIRERGAGRVGPPNGNGKAVGPRTVERDLRWLVTVLNWAVEAEMIQRNPLRNLKWPKERNPQQPLISHDDYLAMLRVADQIDTRLRVALVVTHETGRRISAVLGLRWEDILFDSEMIHWRKETDKIGLDALVPASQEALRVLRITKRSSTADSDEVSHPVRAKGTTWSEGRGPPIPREEAHRSERSDAGLVCYAVTVSSGVISTSFLRMDAPVRVMRCA